MITIKICFGLAVLLFCSDLFVQCKRTIEVIEVKGSKLNPEKFEMNLKYKKLGKDKYGLAGNVKFGIDLDSSIIISAQIYNSFTANGQYKLTTYGSPPSKIEEWMNSFYAKLLQPMLAECSDLQKVKEGTKWTAPYPKGNYKLNDCVLNSDNIPELVELGYYRLELKIIVGKEQFESEILFKVNAA